MRHASCQTPHALRLTPTPLLDDAPWSSSELLGMHGGYADLELLDSRLPHYRQRGFAEDRRKLEAAIRKIGRRLVRAGSDTPSGARYDAPTGRPREC